MNRIISVLRIEKGVSVGLKERRDEDLVAKKVVIDGRIELPFFWACDAPCIGIDYEGDEKTLIGKSIEFV